MRSLRRARWVSSTLALSICVITAAPGAPALADHKHSLADCTSFDQQPKGEDSVAFTITNACTVPLDCKIEWRVVCAPASKKRRTVHPSTKSFVLVDGTSQTTEASVSVCGDDGWAIDAVEWSCESNKD